MQVEKLTQCKQTLQRSFWQTKGRWFIENHGQLHLRHPYGQAKVSAPESLPTQHAANRVAGAVQPQGFA